MPDFSTPQPVSEVMDEDLFDGGHLPDDLRLKCRYHYVHERIQNKQDRDEDVPERLMDTLNELEKRLMDEGMRPSDVLSTTMST